MNRQLLGRIIERSYELMPLAINSRHRHFSFLLDGNKIVSVGYNLSNKTHPLAYRFGHKYHRIHSEVNAIAKLGRNINLLNKYRLINVRLTNCGNVRLAKPCKHCQSMLDCFGLHDIWFTTNFGNFEKL